MKKVDRLGRIVIPLELRERYGLCEGVEIEFVDSDNGLTIRASDNACKICHNKISHDNGIPLCEKCILEVLKKVKR